MTARETTATLTMLCTTVDAELATFMVIASQLPATGLDALIAARFDMTNPLPNDATDDALLARALAWLHYRAIIALAEPALVCVHEQLTDAELATWLRGAS